MLETERDINEKRHQMNEWHGWKTETSAALHIGVLPGRKSVVLYKIDGSVLTPLAYFRDEDGARDALRLFDEIIDALPKDRP